MWLRANGMGMVHACKGASHAQTSPVRRVIRERLPHSGRPIPGGLPLYMLDTGTLKTMAMSRLLNPESSQPCRLNAGARRDLVEQLAAEHQIRKGGKGAKPLHGMKVICAYMEKSESTVLKYIREEGLPAGKIGGERVSDAGRIDAWRLGRIG